MREISIAIFYKSSQIFIMRNLTDFLKTVETGVDPRLVVPQTFEFASDWLVNVSWRITSRIFLLEKLPLSSRTMIWFLTCGLS